MTQALESVEGVTEVVVDHGSRKAGVRVKTPQCHHGTRAALRQALQRAGFDGEVERVEKVP